MKNVAAIIVFVSSLSLCMEPVATQRPTVEDALRVQCAYDLSTIVLDAAKSGYAIAQAVIDCSLTTLVELGCASDITDLIRRLSDAGALIAKTLVTCDGIGNLCTYLIIESVALLAKLANTLVAAAIDCVTDPFLCTYDTVTALDVANAFIVDIFATSVCPQIPPPLVQPRQSVMTPMDVLKADGVEKSDMSKFYERRLLDEKFVMDSAIRGNVTESLMERFSYNSTIQGSVMKLYSTYFGSVANAKTLGEQHAEMQRMREQLHLDVLKFGDFAQAIVPKDAGNVDPARASAAILRAAGILRERMENYSPRKASGVNDTLKPTETDMVVV